MLFRNQKNHNNENKNNISTAQHEAGLTANILELDASAMELVGGGSSAYEAPSRIGG